MITISIRSFGGIDRADIGVSGIALLAGLNAAGKTSACRAIGAALTGRVIPIEGLNKGGAGALVRTGAADGAVIVRGDEGEATIKWPGADLITKGLPVRGSVYAAGLESIVDLDAKSRAKALGPYLKAEPTRADLDALLKDIGVNDDFRNKIWDKVQKDGWDAAHLQAKESGQKLKGAWEEITGENYGYDKAKKWQPAGWSDDLAASSVEALDKEAASARIAHEEALKGAAVDQAILDRLRTDAEPLATLELKSAELAQLLAREVNTFENAEAARKALPPADPQEGAMPCPHCNGALRLHQEGQGQYRLTKAGEKLSATEIKKRREAIAAADGALANARDKLNATKTEIRENDQTVGRARRANDELMAAEAKTGDANAVNQAAEALRTAQANLAAFTAKTNADRKATAIVQNQAIVAALAPDGIRKTAMTRGLDSFNAIMAKLCEAAGWKAVTIEGDLAARYGGRPYLLLSASEQYRVHATLAVAMAGIDESQMLLFDGADILDQAGRNGLVKLVKASGLPALIAMTISDPKLVPDLAKAGLGQSYWIDQAIARPLGELAAKAA